MKDKASRMRARLTTRREAQGKTAGERHEGPAGFGSPPPRGSLGSMRASFSAKTGIGRLLQRSRYASQFSPPARAPSLALAGHALEQSRNSLPIR
jgi:hypothetical protein